MIYSKLAAYYDRFIDHNLNDIYVRIVKKHFNEGLVLDLGCGTGPLSILLAKEGFYVTAADISKSMLEVAFNNSIKENVKINFFVHDITNPLNNDSDIVIMSSDVINYLDSKNKVVMAFGYIKEIMNPASILIFDFLKSDYLLGLIGYSEVIEIDNSTLTWDVSKTAKPLQIKHIVNIDGNVESHIQTTFPEGEYKNFLRESELEVIEEEELEDRIIFVCKKK
ncbi:MAG: class I SAM-dependent methyltransferase [Candidatus Izimaplasma sp.]|nr:class I SAM-dependent methyltransferase [Candidatus Izimaplasma bacterium]